MRKDLNRLIRFTITGMLNTGVDWVVFFLLINLAGVPPGWSQALAYLSGVINSWFFNSNWVFGSSSRPISQPKNRGLVLLRFLIVCGFSTAITSGAMQLLTIAAALPLWADKVLVTALGMGVSFLFYRNWVFVPDRNRPVAGQP